MIALSHTDHVLHDARTSLSSTVSRFSLSLTHSLSLSLSRCLTPWPIARVRIIHQLLWRGFLGNWLQSRGGAIPSRTRSRDRARARDLGGAGRGGEDPRRPLLGGGGGGRGGGGEDPLLARGGGEDPLRQGGGGEDPLPRQGGGGEDPLLRQGGGDEDPLRPAGGGTGGPCGGVLRRRWHRRRW